jgi:outer membrane protein OmpA-like peptidoglycan-associated protein
MGMTGGIVATDRGQKTEKTDTDKTDKTEKAAPVEIASIIAAADRLTGEVKGIRDRLTDQPQPVNIDPAIVPQLQRLGENLRDIQSILARQDGKLDMLRQIDGRMAQWEQQRNGTTVLDEAKRLNGTLSEVRTLLDGQGRRLAVLDDIERALRDLNVKQVPAVVGEVGKVNGALGEVRTVLDGQGRKLAVLDDIEHVLRDLDVKQVPAVAGEVSKVGGAVVEVQRRVSAQTDVLERIEPFLKQPRVVNLPPTVVTPPVVTPPPVATSCFDRGDGATRTVAAASGPRRYERTLSVFFDKAASEPTRGARDKLVELASELNRIDQPAVSIFGSADAQGDADWNRGLAQQRAQAIEQFLKPKVPQLSVQITSARSTDEPASEPYNRIARVEAHGICR